MPQYGQIFLEPEWKDYPIRWGHSFHPMCSYMAMFPARIPHYFIDKFTLEGEKVLDPFSGRGTTPNQACAEGRIGIGNDLNPLAYSLTKAKVNAPQKEDLIRRIDELGQKYSKNKEKIELANEPDKIRMIFHEETLRQLAFLKKELNVDCLEKQSPEDAFITATILGIMHGGSKGFLSIQMPNTFSMSPNYIKNYIADKKLVAPKRDVFRKLKEKTEKLYRDGRPKENGLAYCEDARNIGQIKDGSVKLIVTSPPYLKVIKYGTYNWIRLWFLNQVPEEIDSRLDDKHALEKYLGFLKEVYKEMHRVLADDGLCVFVIGDVQKGESLPINLAEEVWANSAKPNGFKKLTILPDIIDDNTKVTKIWSAKRGNATKVDRLLITFKNDIHEVKKKVNWNMNYAMKPIIG